MNKKRISIITILIAFTVSHYLPAFGSDRGYECFWFCVETLLSTPEEMSGWNGWAGWFYYAGFAISNLLLVAIAFTLLAKQNSTRRIKMISLIMSLHVASWGILNLSDLSDIKIGYYLWLGAYIGLTYITFTRQNRVQPVGI